MYTPCTRLEVPESCLGLERAERPTLSLPPPPELPHRTRRGVRAGMVRGRCGRGWFTGIRLSQPFPRIGCSRKSWQPSRGSPRIRKRRRPDPGCQGGRYLRTGERGDEFRGWPARVLGPAGENASPVVRVAVGADALAAASITRNSRMGPTARIGKNPLATGDMAGYRFHAHLRATRKG